LSWGTIPASTNWNFNTVLSIEWGTYSCPNNGNFAFTDCSVLFSNTPLSPELPNLSQPYTSSQITSTFTNWNNASWIRTPVISDVQYVSLKIPSLQPGQIATFQIRVRNTDNILWDIIANWTATIADNLLQSISNQVYTTVIQEKTNNIQWIVYHDGNHSQDYEVWETVFSWVSVSLYSWLTLLETQLTNSNWSYLFDKLQDWVYSVTYDASFTDSINPYVVNLWTIEALAAWTQLSLTQISSISLSNGQSSIDNDFWLASERLWSIAWTLYYDDEKDKIYDNDTWIQNIIVTLFVDGEMTRVWSTDRDWRYFFDSLPAWNYTIQYTTPSRYSSDSVRPWTISWSEVGDAPSLNTISEIILSAWDESIRNDFWLVIDWWGMVSSVPTPIDTPDTPQTPDETTPIWDDTPLPVQDIDTIPPYSEPETPFIAPDIETFLDQFSIPSTQTDSLESFRNTPKFLQTWVPLEEWMKNLWIETLYSPQVETRPPSRGIPHNSKDYPTELNYWLNTVLLPYDPDAHSAPIYVVIPESWYVIPVEVLEESNPSYQKMIMWEDVSISKDLQNVFAKWWLHHAWSQLPWKPWKNSIALHSSRYKDVPWIYTEWKYPTIGQILATLTPGDDVLYYVKEWEEYIQYTYEVENTLNTSPDNWRLLLAEGGYQSVLYTCTDFWGIDGRLYVWLRMKQENTDKELSLYNPLLYFSGVPQTLKKIINHLVWEIKDEKVIIKVWNNLAPYAQSTMNKNKSIEFIQYKLAKRYQELIWLVL
jgi:hypothetical protein